jgi:hypothetical protein
MSPEGKHVRQRQDQVIRQIAKEPERVAGKRGRSSIESSTSQTSAIVARSIGLAVVAEAGGVEPPNPHCEGGDISGVATGAGDE